MKWEELEKTLSPRLRFLEFVAALSPVPMYEVAKKFEELGLTKKYRAVLTDYERLIKKGIYLVKECDGRKCVQVNIDLICSEFSEFIGLSDDECNVLCSSMKEFVMNLKFKPQVEDVELLKKIVKNYSFFFFIIFLSIVSLSYKKENISDKEIVNKIMEKIIVEVGKYTFKHPSKVLQILNALKMIESKMDLIEYAEDTLKKALNFLT